MTRLARLALAAAALAVLPGAASVAPDPDNPTCPKDPDWGAATAMTLTTAQRDGKRVLIADGAIDERLPDRLHDAIAQDEMIDEIWLRSRGGDTRAGNEAGRIVRSFMIPTRIPSGWTCFSACNFVFMGGRSRSVDPGGHFMVHMFTFTGERRVIEDSVKGGAQETKELIGEIEQLSALLASEDNDFLIRMGVSRKLLTEVMYRQLATGGKGGTGERYCLNQDEVRKYNVMNVEAD